MTAIVFALRLGRWGALGFSVLAFFSSLVQALGFYQVAGRSSAERIAFGQSMSQLASRFTLILPPPTRLDTVGGYVQWRSYGTLAILFAVWALVSASGASRGDEERGLVEVVLATGSSRFAIMASRVAAFALTSFIAALAGGLGLIVGAASGSESVIFRPILEESVVLAALGLSCYSLALLVVEFTASRIATAASGMLLLALFLVNSLSRSFPSFSTVRWLSPFHYYELSQPLSPGGPFDLRATFVLISIAVLGGGAAALGFAYRDLSSTLIQLPARPRPKTYEVSRLSVWRVPVARGIYEGALGLTLWTVGMAVLGVISVALTRSIVEPLLAIPALAPFFSTFVHGDIYRSFLGYIWLGMAQLLFAAFAIAQVARWSAEDVDGRLELIIANPQSRMAVVIERALVLALGATAVAIVGGVVVGFTSHYQAIDINSPRLAAASILLVPFALVFSAAGSVLASWSPRAAVGLLGGFAFASYMISELGPFFRWPDWTQNLSAFKLYGTPLGSGVDWAGLLTMVAIIIFGFGASILLMERRDVGA
jgi:ABC-2 type transport system permease protein